MKNSEAAQKNAFTYGIVFGLIALWGLIYGLNSVMTNENFWFSAYDVTKHDQTLWLLSRGETPFNTIRGLHAFGDHAHFILIPLSVLYHLFPSINLFLFITPFVRGLAVFGIFLIAKEKLQSRKYGLFVAVLMLLNPAFSNVNLDHFYPETWATTTLVFAFYFSVIRTRWPVYYVLFGLTLLMKEDTPLILFMLGLYLFLVEKKRLHGAITAAISGLYFIVIIKLILYFAGSYTVFKGGGQMGGVMDNLFNPGFYLQHFRDPNFLKYLLHLGAPLLFLFLVRPFPLLIALPSLAANMLSGWIYLKTINYHYTIYITPFLFISFIYALKSLQVWAGKWESGRKFSAPLLLLVFISTLTANFTLAKIPLHRIPQETLYKIRHNRTGGAVQDIKTAISKIDDDAPVSADTFYTSHLSHRKKIYQFPVPWYQNYYGADHTPLPDTQAIRYILVKEPYLEKDQRHLIQRLIETGKFSILFQRGEVLLMKRNPKGSSGRRSDISGADLLLAEDFESETTGGKVRVWFGTLTDKGFEKMVFEPQKRGSSLGIANSTGSSTLKTSGDPLKRWERQPNQYCYRMTSETGMDAEFFFMIPVSPNTLYRFSGWIYNRKLENIDSQFHGKYLLQILDQAGDYDFDKIIGVIRLESVQRTHPSGWQYQEKTFTTPEDAKQIKISASFASWGTAKGTLYIDDIRLERISEPAEDR